MPLPSLLFAPAPPPPRMADCRVGIGVGGASASARVGWRVFHGGIGIGGGVGVALHARLPRSIHAYFDQGIVLRRNMVVKFLPSPTQGSDRLVMRYNYSLRDEI